MNEALGVQEESMICTNREAKQRCEKTMLLVVLGASKQVNTQPIKVSVFLNSLLNG